MINPLTFTRHHADTDARDLLIAVYRQVYADRPADPFFSVDRFVDRLQHHAAVPGGEAVIGLDGPLPSDTPMARPANPAPAAGPPSPQLRTQRSPPKTATAPSYCSSS